MAAAVTILLALGVLGLAQRRRTQPSEAPGAIGPNAEFYFIRMQYTDLARGGRGYGGGFGRGWWMQDWPRSEQHFTQGVKRLTRIDIGEARTASLTDDRIFEYPWAYATQVGYWDLSDAETARLREYTLRGGFLVVDAANGEVTKRIPVGLQAHNSLVSLDGKHVYLGTETNLTVFRTLERLRAHHLWSAAWA